jgi:hypothetical protein
MAEVISGPDGSVLIPEGLEIHKAGGFLLRRRNDQIVVEVLDGDSAEPWRTVVARLGFSHEGFAQFVSGLQTVQRNHPKANNSDKILSTRGAVESVQPGVRTMASSSDSIASDEGDEPGEAASLVKRAVKGDQTAWDALVDRYGGTVWLIARGHGLGAADAADVSELTWLRLVEHLHRIEPPERIGAWMTTTARRDSVRLLRLTGRWSG